MAGLGNILCRLPGGGSLPPDWRGGAGRAVQREKGDWGCTRGSRVGNLGLVMRVLCRCCKWENLSLKEPSYFCEVKHWPQRSLERRTGLVGETRVLRLLRVPVRQLEASLKIFLVLGVWSEKTGRGCHLLSPTVYQEGGV